MLTIWKYEIAPDFTNQIVRMPAGARMMSFGIDPHGELCFWALVDSEAPMEEHLVACIGTGWHANHIVEAQGRVATFVGSVTQNAHVWHLFDLGAVEETERWVKVENGRNLEYSGAPEKNDGIEE